MQTVSVAGTPRADVGKKATKAVRKDGGIPCVMYGGDSPVHFAVKHNDVKALIYTPEFKLAEINVDGAASKCIIKDITFHPVTDAITHIDFLRLVEGRKMKVEVPITFVGASPGVKAGGTMQQSVRRVKLKTTPANLVNSVTVSIDNLELGGAVRIRDIQPMEGVEVMNPPGTPVASVEVPRALKSAASAAEKEGGDDAADAAE